MQEKIITITPAGRKAYLEILVPYLLQNRAHVAEHHFWVNTRNPSDIAYLENLERRHPDFFKLVRRPVYDVTRAHESIWQYYIDYTASDTIYVRLDDDICYVAPDAIPTIAAFRAAYREPFLIYGNIVNNAICAYFQQQQGAIPLSWGRLGSEWNDPVGWNGKKFVQRLHEKFLRDLGHDNIALWKFPPQTLADHRRFSVNVICWHGRDLRGLSELAIEDLASNPLPDPWGGKPVNEEERVLSEYLPEKLARPNMICGDALFTHFAFHTQRRYLETMTTLLDDYRALADPKLASAPPLARSLKRKLKPLGALGSSYAWSYLGKRIRNSPR